MASDLPLALVGTRQGFIDWCREHDVDPSSRDVVHVNRREAAWGWRFRGGEFVGDPRRLTDDHYDAMEVVRRNTIEESNRD